MMLENFIDFKHIFLLEYSWLCFNSSMLTEHAFFHHNLFVFSTEIADNFMLTFHKSNIFSMFFSSLYKPDEKFGVCPRRYKKDKVARIFL